MYFSNVLQNTNKEDCRTDFKNMYYHLHLHSHYRDHSRQFISTSSVSNLRFATLCHINVRRSANSVCDRTEDATCHQTTHRNLNIFISLVCSTWTNSTHHIFPLPPQLTIKLSKWQIWLKQNDQHSSYCKKYTSWVCA